MLQLNNYTPFVAELSLLTNEEGQETLYTLVKATFELSDSWSLAAEQLPVWTADSYYGEPNESSLRYPGEYHLGKLATDILVEGDACAPEEKAVREMPVAVAVGQVRHRVQVIGDRVWHQGRISAAEPFVRLPLTYERAYGGSFQTCERVLVCDERNPVGRFVAGQYPEEELDGEPLPNIEDPNALITQSNDRPEPTGFAPVAPQWKTRSQFAGTYDENWQNNFAPFAPPDFSRRYFNAATPGMIYPGWLQGGEPVVVQGMRPEGDWRFTLPEVSLSVKVRVAGSNQPVEPLLETVLLQPNRRQLVMTWRAPFVCPKQTLSIQAIDVNMRRT